MAACKFTIPFPGTPEETLNRAKSLMQSQGGTFEGDLSAGNFQVSVFGSTINGSYTVAGQDLAIIIENKPFLIPCSTIEEFLRNQLAKGR
jgi:hypothetical protein